jgi:DNA polymerase-3 subunit epsilon
MLITRPLVFFDLETTDVEVTEARIIQLAYIKLNMDGTREEKSRLINPTIPIPKESIKIHGITDEMVKDAPTFKQIWKGLYKIFENCDIAGYNSDIFDIPVLIEEFARIGILFPCWDANYVDVLKNERRINPNTLSAVYERWTGKTLEGAHDALNDVRATSEILMYQLDKEPESTPQSIDEACQGNKKRYDIGGKTYYNEDGIVCWGFGKLINKPVLDQTQEAIQYYNWVLNGKFPSELKNKLIQLKANNK